MADFRPSARVPLLMLGMLSLAGGVLAGLARLDWSLPAAASGAAPWHGALMISTFLGTVISLERAVALGRGWAYGAPAMSGMGGVVLLVGAPLLLTKLLLVSAAAVLMAASVQVLRRQLASFTLILGLGAICWLVGNLIWLAGNTLTAAVPWWLAFLVLTIAGERLELTRFLPTPAGAKRLFYAITVGILAGVALSHWREEAGLALFAASLLALALWLLRYDIARRNARTTGLTRFIALCLLSGYGWLMLSGLLGLAGGFLPGHLWHDATLHAVGIGFVFSMIFGHAPIIFPAVVRVRILYHSLFYVPLLVLHASLGLRIYGGLGEVFPLRREGGLLNAVALLMFIVTLVVSVRRDKQPMAVRGGA